MDALQIAAALGKVARSLARQDWNAAVRKQISPWRSGRKPPLRGPRPQPVLPPEETPEEDPPRKS